MIRKVCKTCRIFVKGNECQICKGTDFSDNSKGRIFILDANESEIAKRLEIKNKGEYAIKI